MPVLIHSARRGQNPAVIFPSALLVEGSAPKPLWTQNFILRLRVLRTLWTMTGSPLAVVFFFLLRFGLLHRQDPIHIVLDRQQFPHGGAGLPVLSVSRFLVRQQLGVLGLKLLDGGQFLHVQLIEGFLGGLVQQDFLLMFLPEFP